MNTSKNILIGILTGLLVLILSAPNTQSAPNSYDAVKLINYEACVNAQLLWENQLMVVNNGNGDLNPRQAMSVCRFYLK
jgi:hypothetical protein